ncbi:MAG TPA: hypothetical protein VIY96_01480, partial [Thermoanaerobaculia bacterium]
MSADRGSRRRADHSLAVVLLAALSLLGPPALPAASAGSAEELVGLWKAKRWFGPDARGALVIRRSGETWTADMMGRTVPIRVDRGELTFELPNG